MRDLLFPKPSIPVQVGVRSPDIIDFELTLTFSRYSHQFLRFPKIIGGKLGEGLFQAPKSLFDLKTTIAQVFSSTKSSSIQNSSAHEIHRGSR